MPGDPDENTKWNNHGQQDASEGRMRHGPWKQPFESDDDYAGRRDAYDAGYENALDEDD